MKDCVRDGGPCRHEPCLDVNGVRCCAACRFVSGCTSVCPKVRKEERE